MKYYLWQVVEGKLSTSQNNSYVDNLCSTPYPPRETVAYGEGERYGGTTGHPSAPGIPAAPAAGDVESCQSRLDCGLSRPPARAALRAVGAGRHPPRPEKFCGPHARGTPGRPVCGPDPDHIHRHGCLD